MRKYELMLIINPDLITEDKTSLIKDIESEITASGSTIVSNEDWWARDLAYKIRWSKIWNYLLYIIESDGKKFFDITKVFNIKKDIWRHMFVKIEE